MVSAIIEYHIDDTELIRNLFGDTITAIRRSDFPTHFIARFENAPYEIFEKLNAYWGQFEWIIDEEK
jgi:hypothetical protein